MFFSLFVSQENLLRLVNIEYSVHGQRDLLQPGRVWLYPITTLFLSEVCQPSLSALHHPCVALYTIIQLGIPSQPDFNNINSWRCPESVTIRWFVKWLVLILHICFFYQVFVKEGTLMKVSRKSRQPRHLFLVNAVSCLFPVVLIFGICVISGSGL